MGIRTIILYLQPLPDIIKLFLYSKMSIIFFKIIMVFTVMRLIKTGEDKEFYENIVWEFVQ